jgi:hypothetical protein
MSNVQPFLAYQHLESINVKKLNVNNPLFIVENLLIHLH